jgi:hypothetical protein
VSEGTAEFIGLLTEHQVDMQAFILSSLGDYSDTLDELQRTNIVLWKKASQFRAGAPFLPWALKVAKFEVLAFMRARRRDRQVFCPEVVEVGEVFGPERGATTMHKRAAETQPRILANPICARAINETDFGGNGPEHRCREKPSHHSTTFLLGKYRHRMRRKAPSLLCRRARCLTPFCSTKKSSSRSHSTTEK